MAPNTVRRILDQAGLWPQAAVAPLPSHTASRTAEEPGQTANVDLCFVPATHIAASQLPTVSGSSGRLVIEAPVDAAAPPTYPGRIFEDATRSYEEAMPAFVAASRPATEERTAPPLGMDEPPAASAPRADEPPATLLPGTGEPPAVLAPRADEATALVPLLPSFPGKTLYLPSRLVCAVLWGDAALRQLSRRYVASPAVR